MMRPGCATLLFFFLNDTPTTKIYPLSLHAALPIYPEHGDPAHQLGIKISGLLRHHFARRRDFHHLLDVAGIQQKRNLRASAVHGDVEQVMKIATDRKSTRLNSSHGYISYAVFCLKK